MLTLSSTLSVALLAGLGLVTLAAATEPERREWTVDVSDFLSKGRNTPLDGCKLKGLVVATISGGRIAWRTAGKPTTSSP